ncbi:Threonine synthase [Rhodovulum sp. PH10]|uniref:pyridoxal-phosphate dependent enzyme n=1 Tax=Rhodovulum sp. PH10 TaxID=1187851 RepID=UPI00027C205A|nr:pyridoxal-phosphate dependent enzyme [Rhodovulum sp. PH10]EJW10990.1 Threonine synthase [Rhodovulum sp. PH10]
MRKNVPSFVCHGCGAEVFLDRTLPFACPNARAGDDVDHLLVPRDDDPSVTPGDEENPFLRYRSWLTPYRLARAAGLSDEAYKEIVKELDEKLITVDGRGFRITPMAAQPALARAVGLHGPLLVKNETGNVAGSHKARHLMGVLIFLRVLEAARLPAAASVKDKRLAIASCGNAALAAAVVARAADKPLDVFIPPDAEASVVARLRDLGAAIKICERRPSETGDPCVSAFRAAVAGGALPFGVQGPDNGLAVEGARTLAFEIAEFFARDATTSNNPGTLAVQVGGGALASALAQGFALAARAKVLSRAPRLLVVQTEGCAPLARAVSRADGVDPAEAARARSRFMWPWEQTPTSLAHGILDDETYDWLEILKSIRSTGGAACVVDEETVAKAHALGRAHTGIDVSATGTAGLAGVIASAKALGDGPVTVIFSGVER